MGDVCCPTVCVMHVRSDGGTNAHGVDREVHGWSCKVMSKRLVAVREDEAVSTVMNALTSEIALVLDELESELTFIQHIHGVLNSEPTLWAECRKERQQPCHFSVLRVSLCLQHDVVLRLGHVECHATRTKTCFSAFTSFIG